MLYLNFLPNGIKFLSLWLRIPRIYTWVPPSLHMKHSNYIASSVSLAGSEPNKQHSGCSHLGVPCSRSTVWRRSTNFKSHLFPGRLCIFCGSGGSGIYLNPFLDFKSVLFFTVHTAVGRVVNLSDGEPVRSFCISSIALSWHQTIFKSHAAGASCGFCLFKTL